MWYKHKGGSVIKSLDVSAVVKIYVMETTRPLVYVPGERVAPLRLLSEVDGSSTPYVPVQDMYSRPSCVIQRAVDKTIQHFAFAIVADDGKEMALRASKVDKVIKWINILAQVRISISDACSFFSLSFLYLQYCIFDVYYARQSSYGVHLKFMVADALAVLLVSSYSPLRCNLRPHPCIMTMHSASGDNAKLCSLYIYLFIYVWWVRWTA